MTRFCVLLSCNNHVNLVNVGFSWLYFYCRYFGTPPVEINLLPFVAEWDNQKKAKSFIHGSPLGNTTIDSIDEGFMPGAPSITMEKRHFLSMKENQKNSFMFQWLKNVQVGDHYDEDGDPIFELVSNICIINLLCRIRLW